MTSQLTDRAQPLLPETDEEIAAAYAGADLDALRGVLAADGEGRR